MKRLIAFLVFAIATSGSLTGAALGQSDFYIRSHYSNGGFTGSHEILSEPKEGYYEARYCDLTFWVSSSTVAWTEEQAAAGQSLVVEEDNGAISRTSRKIVCDNYKAFATLDDLGLKPAEIDKIRGTGDTLDMKSSRIRTIRDAFKQYK
ncbi:hypothetical protein [Roseibium marinum]|uniref:Uncharacterized protein n=1 Tax=Roseibium marinum TaxID=281252 RepID=A0A2S3UQW9_9HYPH|nr:hypothetical protein [Roseibium marinum]POF30074.1 hypothetical protein CLV41_107100 [Roseibium marinum]